MASTLLCTLAILGSLVATGSCHRVDTDVVLKQELDSLFPSDLKCLEVHVGMRVGGHSIAKRNVMRIIIQDLSVVKLKELSRWLERQVFCVAVVVHAPADKGALAGAARLVARVRARKVILLAGGGTPPLDRMLARLNSPFIWLQMLKNISIISLHCPSVSSDFQLKPTVIKVGQAESGKEDLLAICKNPMKGQRLKYAFLNSVKNAIISSSTSSDSQTEKNMGMTTKFFRDMGTHFGFEPSIYLGNDPEFDLKNRSWKGAYSDLMRGQAFLSKSRLTFLAQKYFDLSTPHGQSFIKFISRMPIAIDSYEQLTSPFSNGVWMMALTSMLCLGTMFWCTHNFYYRSFWTRHLVRLERSPVNFYLFSVAKITEPDPMLWFPSWSAGKLLTMVWILLSTFLVMFYVSNLRAHLISEDHEKPIDTLLDVLMNGERVWIPGTSHSLKSKHLEQRGQANSIQYKIAKLAERSNGYYTLKEGLPPNLPQVSQRLSQVNIWIFILPQDIAENRAVFLGTQDELPHYFRADRKHLSRNRLYATKENVYQFYFPCWAMKKYSPATEVVNGFIQKALEAGLDLKYKTDGLPMDQALSLRQVHSTLEPMELRSFYVALMFYAVCLNVSLLACGVEMFRSGS